MSYRSNWTNPAKHDFEKQKQFASMYLRYCELKPKDRALADGFMEMLIIQQAGKEFTIEESREPKIRKQKEKKNVGTESY